MKRLQPQRRVRGLGGWLIREDLERGLEGQVCGHHSGNIDIQLLTKNILSSMHPGYSRFPGLTASSQKHSESCYSTEKGWAQRS